MARIGHRSLSRRRLLVGAGQAGLTAMVLAGASRSVLAQDQSAAPGPSGSAEPFPPIGPDLVEPQVIDSANGVLEVDMTATITSVDVAGRTVRAMVYNDSFPGPTLRMRPGDTLKINLVSELDSGTNLHAHGFHTNPDGFGDNVLIEMQPGETRNIVMPTLDNHPSGLYWYHPHVHGDTDDQVNGGLAGAIINVGPHDELEGIKGRTERLLIIQATQWDMNGDLVPVDQQTPTSVTRYVNGQLNPVIRIRPGEIQRLRILNAASDLFMDLSLDGHQLVEIGADANGYSRPFPTDHSFVAPGARKEVLLQGGQPGTYPLRALPFEGDPGATVATVIVEGDPVTDHQMPTQLLPLPEDLSVGVPAVKRTLVFDILDGPKFVIDGKEFDHHVVNQTVKLGDLEEWRIENASSSTHPFHIHVNDFQVVAINDEPIDALSHRDTLEIPANGSFTMRIRFTDFPGTSVYHCHLLAHEDGGMMGIVKVVA
jgi:FtsP/CotA-like multicopper oxidase with cupredoxin domain